MSRSWSSAEEVPASARASPICEDYAVVLVKGGEGRGRGRGTNGEGEPAGGEGREAEEDEERVEGAADEGEREAGEAERAEGRAREQCAERAFGFWLFLECFVGGVSGGAEGAVGRRRGAARAGRERLQTQSESLSKGRAKEGTYLVQKEICQHHPEQRDARRHAPRQQIRIGAPQRAAEHARELGRGVRERAAHERPAPSKVSLATLGTRGESLPDDRAERPEQAVNGERRRLVRGVGDLAQHRMHHRDGARKQAS